jgi:hypothetical protein
MLAYKLFQLRKDGTIGSLFINRKRILTREAWLEAEAYPTKGFAFRPFWHCTSEPNAPHLSNKHRIWLPVEMEEYEVFPRPKLQGGIWYLAKRIKILNDETLKMPQVRKV